MNALVLYDSTFGNTTLVARAIAEALGNDARAVPVAEVGPTDLQAAQLIIAGSPTQAGRPTSRLSQFLKSIPDQGLREFQVAAFDTRFEPQVRGLGLRVLMRIIGYAAPRIAQVLQAKGGHLAAPPEGFIV